MGGWLLLLGLRSCNYRYSLNLMCCVTNAREVALCYCNY